MACAKKRPATFPPRVLPLNMLHGFCYLLPSTPSADSGQRRRLRHICYKPQRLIIISPPKSIGLWNVQKQERDMSGLRKRQPSQVAVLVGNAGAFRINPNWGRIMGTGRGMARDLPQWCFHAPGSSSLCSKGWNTESRRKTKENKQILIKWNICIPKDHTVSTVFSFLVHCCRPFLITQIRSPSDAGLGQEESTPWGRGIGFRVPVGSLWVMWCDRPLMSETQFLLQYMGSSLGYRDRIYATWKPEDRFIINTWRTLFSLDSLLESTRSGIYIISVVLQTRFLGNISVLCIGPRCVS